MSYLKIYRKDINALLGVASVLPVICFVGGFYTGSHNQPRPAETVLAQQIDDQVVTTAVLPTSSDRMQNSDASTDNLQDILDAKYGVSADSQQVDTRVLKMQASTGTDHALLNLTSLRSFNDYVVQAGRFSSYDNATKFQAMLAGKDIRAKIALDESSHQAAYLIIVDSFATKEEAKQHCLVVENSYQLDCYVKTGEQALGPAKKTIVSL